MSSVTESGQPAGSSRRHPLNGLWIALALFTFWVVIANCGRTEVDPVARGRYVVDIGGCTDCHTPWGLGAHGPEPDPVRYLSGHPADVVMPPAPALPDGPWAWLVGGTNTAFAGPWGVSYAANLTPHDSGLGVWDEKTFVTALRSGRHMGQGRPILPPMPIQSFAKMTDGDFKAVFAYLKTIKPIENAVPDAVVRK